MSRKRYSADLTEPQWEIIKDMFLRHNQT